MLTGATDGIRDEYTILTKLVAQLHDPEFTSLVEGLEAYVLGYCEARYAEAGAIWAAQVADPMRTDFAGWTALYCWPDCALLDGDHGAALDGFRAALQSARERGQSPTVAYQLEGMSMALSGLGRHEDALQAVGWAATVRQSAGPAPNSWYRAMLDSALARSRDALEARAASGAFARGRALTIDAAVNAALCLEPSTPGS